MKSSLSLKSLLSLSFLIFALPFLQTCSDKALKSMHNQNTISEPITSANLTESKASCTHNVYLICYNVINLDSLTKSSLKQNYIYLIFPTILLVSTIMLVIVFLKKFKQIAILSLCNLILLLSVIVLLYFNGTLEELQQIKIGYYLFLLNTLLIFWMSRKGI